MGRQDRPLTKAAKLYIGGVAAAGLAIVAVRAGSMATWAIEDFLAWAGLTAAIALTEQFPVRVRYRTEGLNLSLTEALWVGALILARPSVLTLAMAAGVLIAQLLRRRAAYKVAFNLGQFVVAVTVAQAIFGLFPAGLPAEPRAWVATAVAMAGYAVVNLGLVALIIALIERKRLLEVVRRPLTVNLIHFSGNTAIGLAAAVIWKAEPGGLVLFCFPLGLAYVAYRSLARNLQEGESIRDLIVQNASDGIFVVSAQGATLSWNPAMERITGYSADEAVGRDWREILGPTEWHVNVASATDQERMLLFAPVTRRDGNTRWIRYSANVISSADSRTPAMVVVVHDATAEYEAERLKSDFVATISHELRTPLTPLKGFLQALISGTTDDSEEARQEYYRIMLRQATRLETLVNQLLDLSRIESEAPAGHDRTVDLTALAAEHVWAFAEQQPRRQIQLGMTAHPIEVSGDARSIGLVVSNLLSNAIKYSGPQTVVSVQLSMRGDQAVVSVRDQGSGIPEDDQSRIFDRFFQGRNRRVGEGVGLGLHIAKRLVETAGGRIWFETTAEEGSTFHFSLPLARQELPPEGETTVIQPAEAYQDNPGIVSQTGTDNRLAENATN